MSESQGISPSYSTLPGSQNSLIPAEDTVLGGALVPSLLESGALPIVHITSTPSTPLFDTEPLSTPEVLDPVDLTTPKPLKPFRLPQSSLNTRTSNEVGDTLTGSTAASPLVGTTGTQSIASTTDFSSNQSVSTSVSSGFAVMAQGTVTMNEGDFDGNPTDLTDDALIYAGSGFTINGNPVLPVQRDAAGNPLRDANGRLILVDRAVAVAAGYSVSNASTQQYANLLPPQIVEQQTVTVPAYSDLRQQELSRRIPAGTPTVTFNAQQNPLNSAADWSNRFPPPGTATNPTVVQVTGGGLNVPAGVNLSHTIIQVAQGDINFNGSGHTFTNVMLVTNSGNINLSNLSSTDLSAFASGSINMNNGARFGGIALLASESTNGSVNFNGATTTTDSTSNLRVVSQGSITFNAAANTRGAFLSVGNFTYNNTSTLLGSIGAKGNVIFNAPATVIAASISGPDTTAPELTVALTQDTAPGGTTNTDRLTFDPTITGSVTDSNAIVEFRAGFGSISTSDYTDILASRQANGSFTLNRTQLEQIYGGVLADGTYTLNLIAKDQAGNSSSSSITFTLDTTTATPTLSLVPTSDSGQSNSDRITQVTTPQLAGTADVGTTVRLYSNGVLVGQGSSTGTWQITTSSLANGVQNLTAIAEDNAGNLSAPSTPLPITVDALLPQLTLTTPLTSPLRVGATLTGTVDGTGSAVTALSYRFDQRPDVAIAFDSNGSFNQPFDLGGLTNGVHTLTLSATDLAGNITVTTFSVTVELDIDAPVITAALANDTAANNSINTDRLTSDPTITGTVIDTNGITGFRAGFDNTPLASFVDILADLTSDRRFTLNRARLETIYGGSLPDGSHVLRLQSQDEYGNLSGVYEVAFTLDTTPPATPTIDLAPTSDTGTVGDRRTTATVVTLVGQSDPGVRVTLEQTGDIALADGEGRFTFTDVALVPGDNSFTVRASDGAGNLQTSTTIIYRSTPPNTLTLTSNQVLENSPTGTLIGQLVTSDPDAGDTSTLTLVDDAGGRFQLVGDQLQVSDSTLLDFESGSSYAITVRSTDGDGLSLTETFTITLTNANEAPNFTSTPITVGQTGTLYQYTIVTTDPDTGDTRTIRASALPEWLSLVDNGDGTAVLQGLPVPGSYPIELVVEDAAGLSATQTFTLTATLPLMEGAVFTTGQTVALTIPTTPSILRFKINTQFDGADPDSINDAFEVALVDASGRSLVHTIGTGRDAFFNWSEGEGVALGAGASYDAATGIVSLNLTGSPTGAAQLVFRLVNNDSDTTTAVQVSDLALTPAPAGTLPPVQVGNPAISLATPLATPDFTQLSDVSPSVQVEYHRTTFDPETEVLYADISLRNLGEYSTNVPLLVAVTGISDPTVQLLRPDGTTPNGIPYYDFSQLITTGRLDPNAETAQRSLVFYNPNGVQFTYELIVLAQLNRNPVVETAVATEVVVGQPYRYSVGATDLDDDTLTYTLASAPDGMTVNTQTGLVTWNTTGVLPRNYSVEVQVSDGRGGTAQQSLTVAVILPVPNRLPLVTSTPPVDARVNAPYTYQIAAQDPDGDALTYTLASGPAGMQVNATTGLVSWTPSDGQQGIQAVVVQVSDNRGESTQQAFNILTRLEQGNHNPFITSTPETTVYTQSPYRYQVQAVDPDGDTLSYALLNPPQGMTIHPTSGLITWTPTLGSGSIPPVTVQVRDGRGGVQEQVLTLTVEPTTGEIRGQIWEDRNRNGQIDASERGLTGVQVYLDTNNNQQLDAGEVTTLVDETGHYRFTGLAAGSYLVREVVPASFTLTSPLTTQLGSNVITNGSFETLPQEWTPTFFGNFFWINVTEDDPAQRQIPGWQVLNRDSAAPEDVDITPQSLWPASDGQYSIELEGYYGGTVAQTFATIPGLTYRLTFDHAGHPFFGDQFKTVEVRIGNRVERFTYDRFDPSVQAGFFNVTRTGWREASLEFTATDTQTTLQFGKYRVPYAFSVGGPAIDDVAVRPVIPTGSYLVTLAAGQRVEQIDFGNAPAATAPNNQPQITSAFPTQTEAGQFFQYDAQAIDPDQQSLTYDLPVRPQGMTIDPQTGRVLWTPTTDQVGLYNVVLRVRDGQRGVDLQTFQLEVTPLNADPVFTSVLSTEVRPQVGKPFTYQAVALDLDGDSITYSLAPIVAETFPTGVTINPTTGVVSWTPTALGGAGTLNGEIQPWQITIQASDGKGGIALQTLDLVVEAAAPNQAPTILSSPRTSTRPGSPYFYQVRATDIDGDPLTYNLDATSLGKGMQIQNGLLVWTPSANQFGAHAVVVQVSDGIHTVNQAFTLTVTNPVDNAAPVITSTPNLVANLGREYQYNLTGTDADGDYRLWSLSQGPSGMVIDAQRGTLRWTPTLEQVAQTHTIVVRLTDALGSYVEQRFDLIATGVNVPPVIRSIPITQAGVGQEYVYTAVATDAENDALTFSLPFRQPGGMTISRSGIIRWTPAANQQGSHVIDVRVTDSRGGESTQTFTIEVGAAAVNRPPVITSSPILRAPTGASYQYTVTATDPDVSDALIYQLLERPDGMQINATSGEITCTTPVTGNHRVVVSVSDAGGLNAYQSFVLAAQANAAPTLQSTAPTQATPGVTYAYDIRATDTDGNSFTYALDPASLSRGMILDALGRLRWAPSTTDLGVHPVVVTVTDAYGASVQQPFDITVTADTQAPRVSLVASTSQVTVGSQVTFQARATDNVDVAGLQLLVGNQAVVLDANGFATVTLNQTGTITARARASDTAGNQTEVTTAVVVSAANAQAPIARLNLSGIADGVITSATNLIGTVDDPDSNSVTYTVEAAPIAGGEWRTIFTGNSEVTNNTLGSFDPSLLQNDTYALRLTATDAEGNSSVVEDVLSVAGELKLGNFRLSFTDLSIPVTGIPITLTRTYDTLTSNTTDDFGYGWRMEFRDTDLRTSLRRDAQLEELGRSPAFRDGTRVYLTLPGGKREGFTFRPTPNRLNSFFGTAPEAALYHPAFVADNGVTSTLSVRNADGTYLNSINGQYSGVNGTGYNPANPEYGSVYILTTKDGTQYEIDARSGDLLKVTDLNGNSLTYTDAGVFSSTGQSITFERDAQGRIVSVQDPMQEYIRYEYNAQGDLISVTDREQNTTRMEYNGERPHYLDRIIDPLDRPGVRNEYDEQGRLQFMVDAKGNPVEMSYDPTNSTQTVYDQLRNPTTYVYDERGNILTEIDAEGQVTTRAYDEDNNVLTETIITAESGPEGWTTTYTYDDQRNQLTQTNALNQTDYYTYNARGQLLTNTNSLGHTTSYTFDARGNVAFMTDATGYTIAYTYDRFGNSLTINEGANDITTFEYDQFGNKTKEIDALGQVTTFTYDVNGNQLTETTTLTTPTGVRTLTITRTYNDEGQVESVLDTENGLTQYGYDANGNQVFVVDAEGRRTQMRYNERNELIETIYADDTPNDDTDNLRSTVEYDAVGNKVAISDWAGNITRYSYDALRRPTGMVLPDDTPNNLLDNLQTGVEYDQAGRMTTLMKDGVRTEFEYDAVGRIVLTRNINAQGQRLETRTVYDAAGRKISETDPLNHTTRFVYDELDRLTETIFADGSRSRTTYDASGDAIATTDQLGRTTSFDYNVLDQLTAVVDAKQQRTTYQYNEAGNLVAQTDANNRTTRYEYDGLGRRTAIVRPMLQRSEMEYNRVGNLIEVTDFNGEATQYEYNSLNQLTAKHFLSDNQSVEFTYTTAGRRDSVTDERGVTQYLYDAAGRLLTRTEPDNTTIAYTYDDVTGQVETITTPSGTTTHHYSALGQLERVIASTGETVYTYNAVGNLAETILPNGVRQTYQYDVLNRVTAVETKDATGTLLSSYGYTYDLVGNRTSVTELNGRRVEFTYDELYRLIKETTTDPTNGNQIIEYAYDNVGNRMRRTDSTEGVTTYVYDANDRLTSTALGGVATTYTYDNNGNLITVQAPGQQTQYGWNQENRLVEADITTGGTTRQVDYQYDADGIRVSSTVNGQETRYLVDANRPYAEVLQEYAPNGQIGVSYVHGHELISQDRAGDTSFYTHDAHSGVRLLSNESGRVTDTYTYDAYGSLLRFNGTTENNYLYRGEQADPNIGMQYLRARYYDQNTGRFASTDPFEGWQEQPMSRHRYMYGNGNPIRYIDPSGMFNSELTVALTISYALSSAITAGAQFIVGRNYDRIHGSIAWDGDAKSFEFGFPEHMGGGVLSGGVFIIEATSEFVDRRQERGRWLIVAPGLSVPTPPPFNEIPDLSFTYGSVAISSPRILGPHVRILSGGFLALSAGIVTGAGFSHESYIMGYGTVRSDQILGHWNMSVGYDMGIDIFSGISYPIAWESLVGNDN